MRGGEPPIAGGMQVEARIDSRGHTSRGRETLIATFGFSGHTVSVAWSYLVFVWFVFNPLKNVKRTKQKAFLAGMPYKNRPP